MLQAPYLVKFLSMSSVLLLWPQPVLPDLYQFCLFSSFLWALESCHLFYLSFKDASLIFFQSLCTINLSDWRSSWLLLLVFFTILIIYILHGDHTTTTYSDLETVRTYINFFIASTLMFVNTLQVSPNIHLNGLFGQQIIQDQHYHVLYLFCICDLFTVKWVAKWQPQYYIYPFPICNIFFVVLN